MCVLKWEKAPSNEHRRCTSAVHNNPGELDTRTLALDEDKLSRVRVSKPPWPGVCVYIIYIYMGWVAKDREGKAKQSGKYQQNPRSNLGKAMVSEAKYSQKKGPRELAQ